MDKKIAVLLPCYNEEITIAKVIDDFHRELPEAEIYVYDNNSTDKSAGIIKSRPAAKYRLITQQGKGHVVRRMFQEIEADCYVMVDSDDVLHPEAVATLLHAQERHDADIVVGDYITVMGDQAPQWPVTRGDSRNDRPYSQHEALLAVFYQRLTHSAWARIYRSRLFDGIRYPVGLLYEDLGIIYPLLKRCDHLVVKIDACVYGYRQRAASILDHFSPRRADVLTICEKLEVVMRTEDTQYLRAVQSRLLSGYFNILLLSRHDQAGHHEELQYRCWAGIKRLRRGCLTDKNVRLKNKLGILASLGGRDFLCSVIGRNYSPRP